MKELMIYRCEICGNLICMIEDSGVTPECCGTEMTRVNANTVDAAVEKHVPVIKREGAEVQVLVGEQPHPMTPQHYITAIILMTNKGVYVRELSPEDAPEANFTLLPDEEVITAYSWCNIHELWKK